MEAAHETTEENSQTEAETEVLSEHELFLKGVQANDNITMGIKFVAEDGLKANETIDQFYQAVTNGEPPKFDGFDMLTIEVNIQGNMTSASIQPVTLGGEPAGDTIPVDPAHIKFTRRITLNGAFWGTSEGLKFYDSTMSLRIDTPPSPDQDKETVAKIREAMRELNDRNNRLGFPVPNGLDLEGSALNLSIRANEFGMFTTPEFDTIYRAVADGKYGLNYTDDPQDGSRQYKRTGADHHIKLRLTEQEKQDGVGMDALTKLTSDQDSDCIIALLYVTNTLIKNLPNAISTSAYAGGWIDIDDVVKKTGWTPRDGEHKIELRRKAFRYLQFGARAVVIGSRSYPYQDKVTKEKINTRIEAPLWAFLAAQQRIDTPLCLFPSYEVPVQQEIILSREWLELVTRTDLAHMLPMGEVLGSIPADQPSGAWARVIGLALANVWRRQARLILAKELSLTRREILTHYIPKLNPAGEILYGKNPGRALEYWKQALDILVEKGFLAKEEEAAIPYIPQKPGRRTPGWQEKWLDTKVILFPSVEMQQTMSAIAKGQYVTKPRDLSLSKKTRTRRQTPA